MPRDGLQQYAPPAGTQGIPNYTVESARYNTFVSDVSADQNNPRPIVAGGTGANNARDAMINLKGEITGQIIDNYDSFPFISGSFESAAGATSAPVAGHAFTGIAYINGIGNYGSVEARDLNDSVVPGRKYVRQKLAGVWGAWAMQAASDADYVAITGDTMTGPLTINSILNVYANTNTPAHNGLSIGGAQKAVAPSAGQGSIQLYSNDPNVSAFFSYIALVTDPTPANRRLSIQALEQGVAYRSVTLCENGGNVGIGTATPAQKLDVVGTAAVSGTLTSGPHTVTGALAVTTTISAGGDIYVGNTGAAGVIRFGNTGAAYLQWTGATYYNLGGGSLSVINGSIASGSVVAGALQGDITLNRPGGTGAVMFGAATNYLFWNGTQFQFAGGPITAPGITSSANIVASGGSITASAHLMTQNGIVYFNAAASVFISVNATDMTFAGLTNYNTNGNSAVAGHIGTTLGYLCQAGVSGTRSGNRFNIEYTTTAHLWINGADLGQLAFVSDYRVKKDVIDLPGMWDTVKALRPIKYTQAEFQPPSQKKYLAGEAARARKAVEDNPEAKPGEIDTGPLFAADDIERWGFIAHELQNTLTPSASTGVKDDPVAIQSPNPWTIIAALTKTLQEAMSRIEALEQGVNQAPTRGAK